MKTRKMELLPLEQEQGPVFLLLRPHLSFFVTLDLRV